MIFKGERWGRIGRKLPKIENYGVTVLGVLVQLINIEFLTLKSGNLGDLGDIYIKYLNGRS